MKKKILAALMAGLIVYFAVDDKARAQASSAVVRVNQLSSLIAPLLPSLLGLCMANGVACLDSSAFVIQAELNYNQGSGSAANRTIQNKLQESVSVKDFNGADVGIQINQAIAALGAGCGTINIPHGTYVFSTPIVADNTTTCTINGMGGASAGATAGVELVYTGTATPVSAHQTTGFIFRNIQLVANNPSFAADFIDLSHGSFSNDSAFAIIENDSFFGVSGAFAAVCVNLNKAISSDVRNNNIGSCAIGVQGLISSSGDYSNAITIQNNHFSSSTGTISVAHISNPGEAWTMIGNTHEMGTAVGMPKAIACNVISSADSISVIGAWIGDWTNGVTGVTDIQVCGSGAWTITGNEIAGPFSGSITGISVANNVMGISASGNRFNFGTGTGTAFALGTGVVDLNVGGNLYGGLAAFMTGTPNSGIVTDNNRATTIYPGLNATLTGNFTPTSIPTLPASDAGFLIHTGGQGGIISGRTYVGNGTGFQWVFTQRIGSADTDIGYLQDNGTMNMLNGYKSGGVSGVTTTLTCPGGQHIAGITVTGGLVTAVGPCN